MKVREKKYKEKKRKKSEKGEERETPNLRQLYKSKRPHSESRSSSSSSDDEKGTNEDRIKETLMERKLAKPNLLDNDLDIDYIKKCLAETDNGTQFGKLLEEKGYKFTRIHKLDQKNGEDMYMIF
jgi:hypothetical protein